VPAAGIAPGSRAATRLAERAAAFARSGRAGALSAGAAGASTAGGSAVALTSSAFSPPVKVRNAIPAATITVPATAATPAVPPADEPAAA
jgi:hypothetical protein